MAKTLLAVDDSVTMRKVLEITFSGEDFRVITAENAQSALGKLGDNPGVFVIDTVLGGDDGYALAKEMRRRNPAAPILMLASRYAPYDQTRGRDAGADDWADKPFDTQQLIDKVRKLILAKEAGGPALAGAAPAAAAPAPQQGGGGAPYRAPAPPVPAGPVVHGGSGGSGGLGRPQPAIGGSTARTGTLVFGDSSAAAHPAPAPMPPRPAPAPVAVAPAPPPAAMGHHGPSAIGAAVNGQLAGKLAGLGLSAAQADAVLALSRDVVERVVWEVVPQLAETMIKEEIQRLMKE